jgi:hypothetical protein
VVLLFALAHNLMRTVKLVPALLGLGLTVDGFAWMFAMLVSGMGLLVIVYARYYLSADDPAPRFFALLLAVHGRDARRRAVGQPGAAGGVLGADQPLLVPADRLLAPPQGRARGARMALHRHRPPAAWRCWRACCCSATSSAARPRRVLASGDRDPRPPALSGLALAWCCWAR